MYLLTTVKNSVLNIPKPVVGGCASAMPLFPDSVRRHLCRCELAPLSVKDLSHDMKDAQANLIKMKWKKMMIMMIIVLNGTIIIMETFFELWSLVVMFKYILQKSCVYSFN